MQLSFKVFQQKSGHPRSKASSWGWLICWNVLVHLGLLFSTTAKHCAKASIIHWSWQSTLEMSGYGILFTQAQQLVHSLNVLPETSMACHVSIMCCRLSLWLITFVMLLQTWSILGSLSLAQVSHLESLMMISTLMFCIVGSTIDKTLGHACVQTELPSVEARDDFDPALSPFEDKSNAMDSSGDSLDSDMLSMSSEDSDSSGNLDPDDPLKSIIDQISHRILVEYKVSKGFRSRPQSAHAGNCEAGDNSGNSANSANNSRSRATSQTQGNEVPQKGKRRAEDDEDWDDGFRRPPRPTKRVALSPERPRTRALACPYWKLEPQAHGKCFPRKFSRISDVKLHLRRKHKQPAPDYCQRCWAAFEDEADKTIHLSDDNDRMCRYNPAARPPGIDNAMDVALNKKSKRDQSLEYRWFVIWDIVFPGQPRPLSPYIDDSLTEDATQLQEIIVNRWPSILSSIIDGVGGLDASTDTERVEREHLIRATLVRLSDEFSGEQARNRTARSASTYQSPGAQTSSPSNRADSAIEVGSYRSNDHSSADSSGEASRMILGATTTPQLGTRFVAGSQNSAMHNRRERFIVPQNQNRFDIIHDHQQHMQIPPPTTASGTMIADPVHAQTADLYGTGHSLENDLTTNDLFSQLPEDSMFQSLLGSGELGSNALLENMGALPDFDWSTFES